MKSVTKNLTGSVLRYGCCDFTAGAGETVNDMVSLIAPNTDALCFWKVTGGLFAGMTAPEKQAVINDVEANAIFDNGDPAGDHDVDWKNGRYQKILISSNYNLTFTSPSMVFEVYPIDLYLMVKNNGSSRITTFDPRVRWLNSAAMEVDNGTFFMHFIFRNGFYLASWYK